MNYQQSYDKIIQAYFKDEIKPFEAKFCFCGTLNNGNGQWVKGDVCDTGYYGHELLAMERALFVPLKQCGLIVYDSTLYNTNNVSNALSVCSHHNYETALFNGMCAALEVLKEIHRSRGEDVDGDLKPFVKRELVK